MILISCIPIIWQLISSCNNFSSSCLDEESRQLMEELKTINIARKHKPFQPKTEAHRKFLLASAEKTRELQNKYPFIDLKEELEYFTTWQKYYVAN